MMINKRNKLYQEDLTCVCEERFLSLLKDRSIFITGATGLLGVHLIDSLQLFNKRGANIKIYAVGRSRERAFARLGEYFDSPLFNFIEQDVQSPFLDGLQVDFIICAASNTHPKAYSLYPVETMMTNIKGVENALNLAKASKATILFLSSVEIYGTSIDNKAFCENMNGSLNLSTSRSCYTESKRAGEALCQSYIAEYQAKVKIARLCRVFGPTMLLSDTKASSQFILNAVRDNDIILKSDGKQEYSYIYSTDAVRALLYILLYGENGVPYNVSNEECNVRLKQFAQICANYVKKDVIFDKPDEIEKKGYSIATSALLDNSKIKELGWKPLYGITDSISRTITMIKDNWITKGTE